jgi:hypothetical protein
VGQANARSKNPLHLPTNPPAECLIDRVEPFAQVGDEKEDEGNGCEEGHSSYRVFQFLFHFEQVVHRPPTGKFRSTGATIS